MTIKLNFLLVLLSLILLSACEQPVRETYSNNFYIITNTSSETLFFKSADDKAEVKIEAGTEATLDELLTFGKEGYPPEDYFLDVSQLLNQDVYLMKNDDSGQKVNALQLNPSEPLDWEKEVVEESRNNTTIHYFLTVTNEMIN